MATSIRLWRRDAPKQDFRITQVVDGIFDVAEAVVPPYHKRVRSFQRKIIWPQHNGASITLEQILHLIGDDKNAIEFLQRQLPEIPENIDVVIDLFGKKYPIQVCRDRDEDVPRLTLSYRNSESFLGDNTSPTELRFSTLVGEFARWPQKMKSWVKAQERLSQNTHSQAKLVRTTQK